MLHSDDMFYIVTLNVCGIKRGPTRIAVIRTSDPRERGRLIRESQLSYTKNVLDHQLTEDMSNPGRDNRDCAPSSPPFTSSPKERKHITFREETATPSEEVTVGPLEGQGAESFAENSARESSLDKDICSNEIHIGASVDESLNFNDASYPTRFENLSPG